MCGTNSRWNLPKNLLVKEGMGKVGFEVSELPSTNDNEHQVGEYKTRRLVSMLNLKCASVTRDACHGKGHALTLVATRTMDWVAAANHLVGVHTRATTRQR